MNGPISSLAMQVLLVVPDLDRDMEDRRKKKEERRKKKEERRKKQTLDKEYFKKGIQDACLPLDQH